MSFRKKIYFDFDILNNDGFTFCLTPVLFFSNIKYNNGVGYCLSLAFFIWVIKIEYFKN